MLGLVDVLSVAVSGDNTTLHTLQETSELPGSRSTLRVSTKTLLRHDGNDVAHSTVDTRKHIVPDVRLVRLL